MDWKEKLEKGFAQSLDGSKKIFDGAKKQAKKLGEQSVLSLEVRQLESKRTDLLLKLGGRVYELLSEEGQSTVTGRSSGVKELIEELVEVNSMLVEKKAALKKESSKKSS